MADSTQSRARSVEGKPWRIYPEGARRNAANWPIELHEAWAEQARLQAQIEREKQKNARLREQLAEAQDKLKAPLWRRRSRTR